MPAGVEKVRLVGERVTAEAVAVPLKLTVCGLLLALSVTVRVPVTVPALAEVNVTLTVQLAPAARLAPQVLVWAKLALGEAAMLEMLSEAVPELVTVTVCAALVTPTGVEKVRLEGERATAGVPVVVVPVVPPPPHPARIVRPQSARRNPSRFAADLRRRMNECLESIILTPDSRLMIPDS